MSGSESLRLVPTELATGAALQVFRQHNTFDRQPEDEELLGQLDKAATDLDIIDRRYWVESTKSFSVPVDFESDQDVDFQDYDRSVFEGTFACFSKLMIGRIIGGQSVRALCLTFDQTTILPYFETLPERHLLFVPVLAVDYIDRVGG